MQRYIFVGILCMMFWMFLEPLLYNTLFYIRYQLFFGTKVHKPAKEEDSFMKIFSLGFTAALIVCFWPVYLVVTATRFLMLIFGAERIVQR